MKGVKKSISSALGGGEAKQGASSAGLSLGKSLISAFGKVGIAAAVGKIFKDAFSMGGEYEQLAGGMQKIFGNNMWSTIKSDADNAFKTMNLSASDYMNNITGIGATFSQTLGAKTGYETAKVGMQSIADYCSGTGKSVDELMTKYQMISRSTSSYLSIADQFAGLLPQTTSGFLEQAQASGYLSKSYKQLNEVPVAEYQKALTSMIQDGVKNMGLSNNTIKETSSTLTGSLAGMKSSFQNVLTSIASGEDVTEPLANLISTTTDFVTKNFIPMTMNIVSGLMKALPDLAGAAIDLAGQVVLTVAEALPSIITQLGQTAGQLLTNLVAQLPELLGSINQALPQILASLGSFFTYLAGEIAAAIPGLLSSIGTFVPVFIAMIVNNLPSLISTFISAIGTIVQAILQNLPQFLNCAQQIIEAVVTAFTNNLPLIVQSGINLIVALLQGIAEMLPNLISTCGALLMNFINYFYTHSGEILAAGVKIVWYLIKGIGNCFSQFGDVAYKLVIKLKSAISSKVSSMADVGKQLVAGLWSGFYNKLDWIKGKIKGWVGDVTTFLQNLFKIGSPSKLMADEIGQYLPTGIAVGIKRKSGAVTDAMASIGDEISATPISATATLGIGSDPFLNSKSVFASDGELAYNRQSEDERIVKLLVTALSTMKVEMNGSEMGSFVENTVRRAVFN